MVNKVKQYFNKVLRWKKWAKHHNKLIEAIKVASDLLTEYQLQQYSIESYINYSLLQFERDINIYAEHRLTYNQQFCLQDKVRIETLIRFAPKHIIVEVQNKYRELNRIYLGLLKTDNFQYHISDDIQIDCKESENINEQRNAD